ncbi:cytokinin riboside 5'-monophosphate phosphoribohydrolase [Paenibacillus antibioticophila]|uniref:Cytokinin riboside 5'-monophosphate phosphoribohydrolase n=1 Tax=Paenibacillus antibioticophila TaxID=1274374 RepID=A0A919XRK8_9BACL|nr:TIGR00730 family Rossman fold protein [Paenibacillus antibioticophila]GIO37986.1 cytokinin riboside 5'-monophosphate phosphoribohydrolase [Paenibacillus antibioticophila]
MNIAVYCGASLGNSPVYQEAAVEVGEWIARQGHVLVYGGGRAGLMGMLADTVLSHGGEVIGIIPGFLRDRELAHPHLTELIVVDSMPERKKYMMDLSKAYLALPGGPGTLEEITECVSWARIGQNENPCIFYNKNGYYDHVDSFYSKMVEEGFLSAEDRSKILFSDSIGEIEAFIESYIPPGIRQYQV